MENFKEIWTPLKKNDIESLDVGDRIILHGEIITGRDAALPRRVKLMESGKRP